MISINRRQMYGEVYNDVRCLSTDDKPVEGIKNGSVLVEIDTGTRYLFDAEAGEWNVMPSSGGGGGGGGTAGVTSFKGRRGAVVPQAGDYRAAQVNTSTAGKSVQDALDELSTAVQVDATLSPTSQHPVRNSAITSKFNEHEGKLVPAGGAAGAVLAKRTGSDHSLEWMEPDEWMLKDDYDADADGIVDEAELADAVKTGLHVATAADKGRDVTLMTDADKGIANGIVPLDSSRKILPEFLPDSIMAGLTYGGVFNATTRVVELTPAAKSILDVTSDTMTLENSSQIPEGYPANAELFYITTTGGTFADMTFANGDWLISLSTSWKQLQSGNQVSSVNTKTGAVTLDSDDVSQGIVNLYMRTTERAKLTDIEARATRDVNVIQSAAIMTDADGNDFLRMVNKNGSTTDFYGGSVDLSEYLKVDGDASEVYAPYTPDATRTNFTGSETLVQLSAKITGWLQAIEDVAFTADYDDIEQHKPTYNGVIIEGDMVATDLGTLDVQKVAELPVTRTANTMYVVVDTSTTPATVDFWVQLDALYHIETGGVVSYADLEDRPQIDGNEIVENDQTHESLGLVGEGDFVSAPTGKTDGMEFILPAGTPTDPIVLSEIDDSEALRYSSVHTSSNQYINAQLDALRNALVNKLTMLLVDELPDPVTRNTLYYVATETAGVYDLILVDSVGTQANVGTTSFDIASLTTVTTGSLSSTSDWDGPITWVKVGKIVTMYGSGYYEGDRAGAWHHSQLTGKLPVELRPKVNIHTEAAMEYRTAVAETGKLYAPNVVRIMSAGTCELYTRNELGLNPNDFVYWSITYITA